ncbi:MAG: hypothetical protein IJX78_07855 [Bacilli bacterium]|nr:hypothetical protein [Bacilli bacterium]
MKKILNIIKYMPFVNLLSFILFAIPIPLIYGFDKNKYLKTFVLLIFGGLIYAVLLMVASIISINWINILLKYILIYLLGFYFCECIKKYI